MKIINRLFLVIAIFIGMILQVFADYGLAVKGTTDDTISLSWDSQENVKFYQIYYGTNSSPDNTGYEETSEILENTSYDVIGLTTGQKYYFALEGFDESGNSVFMSKELSTVTGEKTEDTAVTENTSEAVGDFVFEKVMQTGTDELELYFSNEISTTQSENDRQFKIESVDDATDYIDILSSQIKSDNPKILVLTLKSEPKKDTEYKVVVISLQDIAGKNMEFGVDSENTFIGGYEQELNSGAPVNEPEPTSEPEPTVEPEPTSKPEPTAAKPLLKGGVSGKDMEPSQVAKDVNSVSQEKEDLPNTGPEHVILFFIALLMSAFFFIPRYIKK